MSLLTTNCFVIDDLLGLKSTLHFLQKIHNIFIYKYLIKYIYNFFFLIFIYLINIISSSGRIYIFFMFKPTLIFLKISFKKTIKLELADKHYRTNS